MPKSFVELLMDNHVKHYAMGGSVNGPGGGSSVPGPPTTQIPMPMASPSGPASVGGNNVTGFDLFNTFRAEGAQNLDRTGYGGAIGAGLQGQGDARNQQSALAQMLMQQAQGGGPNPAALQLQQGTEANARMAASQMASQRGLNPALAARATLDATANMNQQAAGQAGVLRAQQQLAAQGQLGSVLQGQRGQDLGLFGTAGGLQNTQNANNIHNALGAQTINAGVGKENAEASRQIAGAVASAGGSALGSAGKLLGGGGGGGGIPGLGGGGGSGANSGGDGTSSNPTDGTDPHDIPMPDQGGEGDGGGSVDGGIAGGGIDPFRQQRQQGFARGGMIPGDSPRNDIVPAMLSPGEVVLPRSIADDPEGAAAFVRAIRRRKEASQAGSGYGRVLQAGAKAYSRGGAVC